MLERDLRELRENVERYRWLDQRKFELRKQKRELTDRELTLAVQRSKEDADVERWEHGSLAAFFYGVVGKREERLEKEKAEAYEAAVKHDGVKAELDAVTADLERVEAEQKKLEGCEWAYHQAIEEKAAALKAAGKDNGILELEEEQANCRAQQRELKEALQAGDAALRQAREVLRVLGEARSWGVADMVGGGFISTMVKHEKIGYAQGCIEGLQVSLGRFRTELADINVHSNIQIEVGAFARVADYIFDCLFVDWSVQGRIVDAIDQVSYVENRLIASMQRLRDMDAELDEKLLRLKEDWQNKICEE